MTKGTATRVHVQKRWADVSKFDLVELAGEPYAVAKVGAVKNGKVKVTVRTPGGDEFTSKMNAKHGVDVIELVKRKRTTWAKPEDQAEANIVDGLGAVIMGTRPTPTQEWIVPPVDISTIAAHLYIFHGISSVDVRKPGGYAEALELHDAQHELDQAGSATLHEPHRHEADRPVTVIGPRFS